MGKSTVNNPPKKDRKTLLERDRPNIVIFIAIMTKHTTQLQKTKKKKSKITYKYVNQKVFYSLGLCVWIIASCKD
jgi:hypothetical protein